MKTHNISDHESDQVAREFAMLRCTWDVHCGPYARRPVYAAVEVIEIYSSRLTLDYTNRAVTIFSRTISWYAGRTRK